MMLPTFSAWTFLCSWGKDEAFSTMRKQSLFVHKFVAANISFRALKENLIQASQVASLLVSNLCSF